MLRKFFQSGLRNFRKNKTYNFLNIFGLAIGIACAGLIFLWVEDETSYDSVNLKKDRIYMVLNNWPFTENFSTYESTPGPLAPAVKAEIPGVVNTCRMTEGNANLLIKIGDKSLYAPGSYADSSLFSIFTIPFVEGHAKDAFHELYSMVITEKAAKKFFGDEKKVVGKTIRLDNKQDYQITGVVKDFPPNNSIQFDWVVPYEIYFKQNPWLSNWGANSLITVVELAPNTSVASVNSALHDFIKKKQGNTIVSSFLFPMNDWHLRWNFENGKSTGKGRIQYVHMFSLIAWIILFLACINFMNLATARSEKRAREVGVRKVLGSGRRRLIFQFISEANFMAFLSVLVGIVIMWLVMPLFNTIAEKDLSLNLTNPIHLLALAAITLICGVVAGSYPSFYLSSFNPVFVLKGIKLKSGSAGLIRKGLVVMQFSVSIILIISTVIIFQQISHVKNRELGYSKDNMIVMYMQGEMGKNSNAIRQDLLNTGVVEGTALSDHETIYGGNNSNGYSWTGKNANDQIIISNRGVSPEFLSLSKMKIIQGRDFHSDAKSDSSNIIITESLAKIMKMPNPIGAIIHQDNSNYTVVGVVKDFIYGNMYGTPDPLIFFCTWKPEDESLMYVRLKDHSNVEAALPKIESVMKKNNPVYPFQYQFVDDEYNRMFSSEALVSKLSRIFAILAICISCLGLFGLAAFTAERRTKEIGIRKVLGASVGGLTTLLSGEFLKLVAISSLIAFPIAWYVMHTWLQNYQYHIAINWGVFALAGIAALLIAMVTISFQTIRASLANPAKSLRSE